MEVVSEVGQAPVGERRVGRWDSGVKWKGKGEVVGGLNYEKNNEHLNPSCIKSGSVKWKSQQSIFSQSLWTDSCHPPKSSIIIVSSVFKEPCCILGLKPDFRKVGVFIIIFFKNSNDNCSNVNNETFCDVSSRK